MVMLLLLALCLPAEASVLYEEHHTSVFHEQVSEELIAMLLAAGVCGSLLLPMLRPPTSILLRLGAYKLLGMPIIDVVNQAIN